MTPGAEFGEGKQSRRSGRGDRRRIRLPKLEKYEGVDKVIITILILIFSGLFFWLIDTKKYLFAYWEFLALLTLIFVGILRAAGIVRSEWFVLGGSAAIFFLLHWMTTHEFEKYQDNRIDKLEKEMMYDEMHVNGWIEFIQSPQEAVKKELFEFRLYPRKDPTVSGPFEGDKYRISATVPIKKNKKGEEEPIFKRLSVGYEGYYSGCALLDPEATDANCVKVGPDREFNLKLCANSPEVECDKR